MKTQTNKRLRLRRSISIYISIIISSIYLLITTTRLIQLVEGGHYTIALALIFQIYNVLMAVLIAYSLETSEAYTISISTFNKLYKALSEIEKVIITIIKIALLPVLIIILIIKFIKRIKK